MHPMTILAYGMNGVPLPLLHGAPLRLVVPAWVGDHWVKWAYSTALEQEYWQACIAFKQARDCTLFLLTWS
jgi:DMSO/TMAO reductase YedYZ molybdopterin-dependent catalytic subunit